MVAALLVPALLTTPIPAQAAPVAAVCNRYCDARDPALAPAARQPHTATLFGRRFTLHLNDTDAMGWAGLTAASPGDEVWLDRSFDGGRTWTPRLGGTAVPAGRTGWRTLMYNVDDWAARGIGALRACGKAGDRPEIACTPWARSTWNAGDRRSAAATTLMQYYDQGTGQFDTTGWWQNANALTALVHFTQRSGIRSYTYAIGLTYDRNRGHALGEFRNEFVDDTGWWALAWLAAYDLTGDRRYLETARVGAAHMHAYWDTTCGGGVWWKTDRRVKNAITNSLYVQVNAALHNRVPGDTTHLARARAGWAWFEGTGMVNSADLVNDGLDMATCRNDGKPVWSYNQGVPLAALVELHRATGEAALLTRARRLAAASTADAKLNPGGILREPCEPNCEPDGPSFKGIYARGLAALNAVLPDRPYTAYLRRQADSAYARNRDSLDGYGLHWAGPVDHLDAARQQSAVDLMNAV
nr:glycoside hydrolase family 76 protein [Crossiella equi]